MSEQKCTRTEMTTITIDRKLLEEIVELVLPYVLFGDTP
jgi:hypothetical protein